MPYAPGHIYEFQCPKCEAKANSRCIKDGHRQSWDDFCDERAALFEHLYEQYRKAGKEAYWVKVPLSE